MAESDRWLALETSGVYGSLAAGVGERLLHYLPLPTSDRTIRTLAPSIETLLAEVGWKPAELGFFSVGVGPGSFTGLRIGVMTAKTLAYALGKPIVAVDTLAAIAARVGVRSGPLRTVMDALRGQFFAGRFVGGEPGVWQAVGPAEIVSIDEVLADLAPTELITGPGLSKLPAERLARLNVPPADLWSPTAEEVGRLGWAKFTAGETSDPVHLAPVYLRLPAAEEKRLGG